MEFSDENAKIKYWFVSKNTWQDWKVWERAENYFKMLEFQDLKKTITEIKYGLIEVRNMAWITEISKNDKYRKKVMKWVG
jgi:hypothetical protein